MYFNFTSEFNNKYIIFESLLQAYFWFRKQIHKLGKPTSSILLNKRMYDYSFKIWDVCIIAAFLFLFYMHFKNRFFIYLKYTWSLLNSWWTQSILETYFYKPFSKSFPNYFHKVANFGSQNISRSIYFIVYIELFSKTYVIIWNKFKRIIETFLKQ